MSSSFRSCGFTCFQIGGVSVAMSRDGVIFLGQYSFAQSETVAGGHLSPQRDPGRTTKLPP